MSSAPVGTRNNTLNRAAFSLGQLIGGREITFTDVFDGLSNAAAACGLPEKEAASVIERAVRDGADHPRLKKR